MKLYAFIGEMANCARAPRPLFALAPGTISEAQGETRYGLHIIRLDRPVDGCELPFELVAERIADYLRDSVKRRASR